MSEVKKVSVTDEFKGHVQAIIQQELGVKVSKDKAWKLFKSVINGTEQFVATIDGNKLSLAGVGKFEIRKSPARGKKADEGYPFIPRFRFKPSSKIADEVEKRMGVGAHDDIVLEDYGIYKAVAPVEDAPVAPVVDQAEPQPQKAPEADPFFSL